jgi:hypothetical protein
VISPTQRSLLDTTQHSYETDNHTHVGIQTQNPSKRASPESRLKARVATGR